MQVLEAATTRNTYTVTLEIPKSQVAMLAKKEARVVPAPDENLVSISTN